MNWIRVGRCVAACCALLILVQRPGLAQEREAASEADASESILSGLYAGASFAGMIPIFEGDPKGLSVEQGNSYGYQVRVGYRLTDLFATELQYERAQGFSTNAVLENGVARARLITGNLRFIPLQGEFEPYLVVGVGAGQYWINNQIEGISPLSGKQWEFAARFGTGFDLKLVDHVFLNFEGAANLSEEKLLDERIPFVTLSAGLLFRF